MKITRNFNISKRLITEAVGRYGYVPDMSGTLDNGWGTPPTNLKSGYNYFAVEAPGYNIIMFVKAPAKMPLEKFYDKLEAFVSSSGMGRRYDILCKVPEKVAIKRLMPKEEFMPIYNKLKYIVKR